MDAKKDSVHLQYGKLNINGIVELAVSSNCGAISTFIGITRDHFEDKKVLKLEYEAYEPMAIKEMHKICAKLRSQWNIERIAIFHRLGEVPVSEASIVIAISSPHRKESLQAVQLAIDSIKATVPIWKKEVYENGIPLWKENEECSWSSIHTGNYLLDGAIVEVETEIEEEPVVIDQSMVQIQANSEELNRRIQAFMTRKREQANMMNLQEFCYQRDLYDENESSCARVSAVLLRRKDSKSHVKVHRVVNAWGPQTVAPSSIAPNRSTDDKETNYPSALEERLSNSEKLLGINKPVPRDIYTRIKRIEDRLLELESISPEYKDFWSEVDKSSQTCKSIRKRTFSSSMDDNEVERYAKRRR